MVTQCPTCNAIYKIDENRISGRIAHGTCAKCKTRFVVKNQTKNKILCDEPVDNLKSCPFCGEDIKANAIKCRYCNEWLNKKEKSSTSDQKEPEYLDSSELINQEDAIEKGINIEGSRKVDPTQTETPIKETHNTSQLDKESKNSLESRDPSVKLGNKIKSNPDKDHISNKNILFISWKGVLRDVIIIYTLLFAYGFIVGFGETVSQRPLLPETDISITLLIFITGFFTSACIVKVNRFKHLYFVALSLWITNLIGIPLGYFNVVNWIFSIVPLFVTMAIGGFLSFLFVLTPLNDPLTEKESSHSHSSKNNYSDTRSIEHPRAT